MMTGNFRQAKFAANAALTEAVEFANVRAY
jgi:hypothetical protein